MVHLLMHADDATTITSSRDSAIKKLHLLIRYCKRNWIIPQFSKCEFMVVNAESNDGDVLPFGDKTLKNVEYITILGSHLVSSGILADDLDKHMKKKDVSCVKYFNFLKSNQLAPLPGKSTR